MARAASPRARTVSAAMAALAAAMLAAGGCELLVPDNPPPFTCRPGPGSCPNGGSCAAATGHCVPFADVCTPESCPPGTRCDTGTLACQPFDAASPPSSDVLAPYIDASEPIGMDAPDAVIEGDSAGSCRGLTCKCSGSSDCASGICGAELTVTSDVYNAAGKANFCTKPCCTSADCDASTVCFATAAGGSYCVRPDWLGRSTKLGAKTGGQACAVGADCRSGACTGSVCADTCCSSSRAGAQCGASTACRFGAFPGAGFDVHFAAHCAASSGLGPSGTACRTAADCQSGFCDTILLICRDACESSQDCGVTRQSCGYTVSTPGSAGVAAACGQLQQGTGLQGSSCQTVAECQNGFCDPSSHQCTDVCFADADCTVPGWRCRPEVVQFGGSYSVLCCGS
jgi:hypothetical protein